jgi:hypothetical protein
MVRIVAILMGISVSENACMPANMPEISIGMAKNKE